MYLLNPATEWPERWFESRLAPHPNETNLCVTGALPHHSAWRVLMIADNPGRFIESTVVKNLSPESEIKDTAWIRPGKCAWDWWGGSIGPDGQSAFTNATPGGTPIAIQYTVSQTSSFMRGAAVSYKP